MGPELWATALLKLILLFFPFLTNGAPITAGPRHRLKLPVAMPTPPPPWEWGRGGGNGKHLSNVTISTEEPGFQEGNNSSVTIFSSK